MEAKTEEYAKYFGLSDNDLYTCDDNKRCPLSSEMEILTVETVGSGWQPSETVSAP